MRSFRPWKVLHIELSESIPDLGRDPKYRGFAVVVWWHGIALGQIDIVAEQLPMPSTQLTNLLLHKLTPAIKARISETAGIPFEVTEKTSPLRTHLKNFERPLSALRERLSQPVRGAVSVVVCTRERPASLARCLTSLQKLTHRPHEVLVVDNAPTSGETYRLVSRMPGIRYVVEPQPGLSRARNTGIRCSTGEVIAFTDDDVEVHRDWLTCLLRGLNDSRTMAVTGLVVPAELETESQVIFEKVLGYLNKGFSAKVFDERFYENTKSRGVPVWEIGAGANMAFRRKIFELVGDFDERLGAGASGCSEDSELWYRILAGGWTCRYEPGSIVFHYHRRELDGLTHQMYQYYRGYVTALLCQFEKYRDWGNLRRLFFTLPAYFVNQYLFGRFRTSISLNGILSAGILGSLGGIKFYMKNSHRTAR